MKKILSPLFVTSFLFATTTKETIQLENPQQIYINENGVLFSPKQNLHIGFSLDKNEFHTKEYQLTLGDKHSIGLYNKSERVGNYFNFTVDDKAPTIELFKNRKKINKSFASKAAKFTVKTFDKSSGIKKSFYQVDDTELVEFKDTTTFSIALEGKHTLKVFSIDNVGNIAEEIKTISIDPQPPKSQISFTNSITLENGLTVVGNNSFAKIEGSDDFSEIANIFYKISRDEFQYYSKPINLYPLKEGNYTASFYANDIVGNQEEIKTKEFFFDSTSPKTDLELVDNLYKKSKKTYVSDETKIEITAKDFSGVQNSYLNIGTGKAIVYQEPMYIKDLHSKTSKVNLSYNSIDGVGNIEKSKTKTFYIDNKSPKLTIKVHGGAHTKNESQIFIGASGTIKVLAEDKESGLQSVTYKIDTEEEVNYTAPISLPDKEHFTIVFYGKDNVNNVTTKEYEVSVDKTLPQIEHYFSYRGLKAVEIDGEGSKTYYKDTTIYINAEDKDSGVDKILFKINDGRELEYIKPLTFKKSGVYNMRITVIDKLGNRTIRKDKIEIKDKK